MNRYKRNQGNDVEVGFGSGRRTFGLVEEVKADQAERCGGEIVDAEVFNHFRTGLAMFPCEGMRRTICNPKRKLVSHDQHVSRFDLPMLPGSILPVFREWH